MSVQYSGYSPVNFTGKVNTTENGNPYKKTNAGKVILPVAGATLLGIYAGFDIKKAGNFTKYIDDLIHNHNFIKTKTAAIATLIGGTITILGAFFGAGALIDKLENKKRRKKADAAAQV